MLDKLEERMKYAARVTDEVLCDPATILRLVRVARAAKVIQSHLDEGARPDQIALDELRAALKETI
jgi:hypothetical protein